MSQVLSSSQLSRIQWSLLALRVGVFIVMFVWTLDKFINPDHSIKIFEKFYSISGLAENIAYLLGVVQLVVVLSFLIGFKKRITYGLIFIMHGGSTLSALGHYFDPFNNLLFFAAWPMWAACLALYLLRDLDTKYSVTK
ncbi:hypothetical protein RS130_12815 [Paraglaciecola aquimarina]|uniref:DoxX protein n=1 Tax=Paraglaciecola aquimarina TaxID=1235557 RepID=A0ABU3SXF4_9ALTE|nr:hypothetical protein [Paraglaciecola aquimarina]MDU0354680.1 hypothetical protein [Paraglaciecola aquimarina]